MNKARLIHGWEHKISKSRQTQATGGKNCEKAGKLPRLCGDIITVVHDYSGTRYSGTIPITRPYENPPFSYYMNPINVLGFNGTRESPNLETAGDFEK